MLMQAQPSFKVDSLLELVAAARDFSDHRYLGTLPFDYNKFAQVLGRFAYDFGRCAYHFTRHAYDLGRHTFDWNKLICNLYKFAGLDLTDTFGYQ